jgi:peptidoglycan/LPS O-acetylase OafA/YrhL
VPLLSNESTIGVINLVTLTVLEPDQDFDPISSSILLLGFALTFFLLWLRRKVHPTGWAIYPAVGLALLAVLTFILGEKVEDSWPIVLLVLGILIIAASLWPRRKELPPAEVPSMPEEPLPGTPPEN